MTSRLAFLSLLMALACAALASGAGAARISPARGVVDVTTALGYSDESAAGTGMVVTASGEVLTNNHVIRGATAIRVVDPSTGRSYPATVVGYSVTSDVAVLQVQGAPRLRTITAGNSGAVKVGQRVTAVGNAGGVGGAPATVRGSVTGVHRTIVASDESGLSERLSGLIRTNAPIQPGDSGGPLENASGRVIGMDTAGSVGFQVGGGRQGFAIPIARALAVAKQVVAGQSSATVHVGPTPFLGISVSIAGEGPMVIDVVPGSPADQAGIVAGETITAVDGQPVSSYGAITSLLLRHAAGDTVTIAWTDQTGASQSAAVQTVAGPPQ